MKSIGIVSFLTIFLLTIFASLASAERGTVTTTGGEIYENVNFVIESKFYAVKVVLPDGEKCISFENIESIIDSKGNVVSYDFSGDIAEQSKDSWPNSMAIKPANYDAKVYNLGVSLAPVLSVPLGNVKGYEAGIGYSLTGLVALSHKIDLRINLSKSGLNPSAEYSGIDYSAWKYGIALQWHPPTLQFAGGKGIPYNFVGIANLHEKASDSYTSSSESTLMYTFGAGIVLCVSENTGVDIGLYFDDPFDSGFAWLFGFEIGLSAYIK